MPLGRPDLEDTRQTLAVQSAAYQNTLEQIEANIFETLSESTGCILDDDYAIQVLNSSKVTNDSVFQII